MQALWIQNSGSIVIAYQVQPSNYGPNFQWHKRWHLLADKITTFARVFATPKDAKINSQANG
jgi:hypothetical protein